MASDLPAITFVWWRYAEADPPELDGLYQTNVGFFHYADGGWYWQNTGGTKYPVRPYPSVWCDPRPPVESPHGPLTIDDLRGIHEVLEDAIYNEERGSSEGPAVALRRYEARLRHAIEQAEP